MHGLRDARLLKIVSAESALSVLRGVPGFQHLPPELLEDLVGELRDQRYDPGEVVVEEGDYGDALYVLVEGRAEVSISAGSGRVVVGTLRAGDSFGEVALLAHAGTRMATVTALTNVVVLSLHRAAFEYALDASPTARATLEQAGDEMIRVREEALRQVRHEPAAPLGVPSPRRLRWLSRVRSALQGITRGGASESG